MSPLLDAARGYAAHGWAIFPVGGKVPMTARGFKDASSDAEQVGYWDWERATGIGWAIPPDLFVLDVDARHRGHESLAELEQEHGRLPVTLTQLTGGGGLHLVFRVPSGGEVRQLAGLRAGIDTRTSRGYIILPPSVHASGLRYAWRDRVPPVEAPAWLVELVRVPAARPFVPIAAPVATGRRAKYAAAVLAGEARAVAETGEGCRNQRLNKAWWRCSQFRDVLDRDRVARELTAAALASGLPEQEIQRVLR